MELENFTAHKEAVAEALMEVASKIRPLSEDVKPSKEFMKRIRLQLLQLPPGERRSAQAA